MLPASLAAALVAVPATPAFAHDGHDTDSYAVDAEGVDLEALPKGGEAVRTKVTMPPSITTAAAPAEWLAPKSRTEVDLVHAVQSGESLGDIAHDYGLDDRAGWRALFDANDEVERPGHIWPGLELSVPMDGDEVTHRPVPEPEPEPEPEPVSEPEPAQRSEERSDSTRASRSASRSDSGESTSASITSTASGGRWDALAACESGGNWSINTGNGYFGGLQFSLSSWQAVGGSGYPHEASKAEQIKRAEMLLSRQGWGAWPACTSKLGWR